MEKVEFSEYLNRSFSLLDDRKSRIFLIIFCGLFSSFFIYFFNPFNIESFEYESAMANFLSIWSAGLIGMLFLGLTQLVLRDALGMRAFTLKQFLVWVLFEFFVFSLVMFVLFGERNQPIFSEFLIVTRYTVSLTFLPYILACLIIAVFKQSTTRSAPTKQLKQLIFKEDNGKIAITIKATKVIYLQSENNYTSVFYLENDKVIKKLVRTNLKKLETEFTDSDLIRIHRSFMINLKYITSTQRIKAGYILQLKQIPNTSFKVSEGYREPFEALLDV